MIRNALKKLLGGNYTENNEKLAILNFAIVILMFVVSGIMLFVLPPEISILQSGGTYSSPTIFLNTSICFSSSRKDYLR